MKKQINLNGKEFTIEAKPEDLHVNYKVFEEDNAETPLIQGYVKWDGCSNWQFPSTESVMFHGCSRNDLIVFGGLMALCWDMTLDLCPRADASLFTQS